MIKKVLFLLAVLVMNDVYSYFYTRVFNNSGTFNGDSLIAEEKLNNTGILKDPYHPMWNSGR